MMDTITDQSSICQGVSGHFPHIGYQQPERNSYTSGIESEGDEPYESAGNAWNSQSVRSMTPSVVSQARNVAILASNHSKDTEQASTPSQTKPRRNRHPTPAFFGDNKPTSQQWLSHFKKVILYHNYNTEECISEFMMAMQGHASS